MNSLHPKYQIFVSSTYIDLIEERMAVSWSIMKLGHIPTGMEAFTAKNDRGWDTIRNVIELSDYYVLILAGRYGSIEEEWGTSWTEHEYDYAYSKGIPILVVIREKSSITTNLTDESPKLQKALRRFITKVRSRHLCQSWETKEELANEVTLSLTNQIRDDENHQRLPTGWYRGYHASPFAETSGLKGYNDLWPALRDSEEVRTMLRASNAGDSWYFICMTPQGFMPWREQMRDALVKGVKIRLVHMDLEHRSSAGIAAELYAKAMCAYGIDRVIESLRTSLSDLHICFKDAEELGCHPDDYRIYASSVPHPFIGFLCDAKTNSGHKGWGLVSPYVFFTSPNLASNFGVLFSEGGSVFEHYHNCFVRYFSFLEETWETKKFAP